MAKAVINQNDYLATAILKEIELMKACSENEHVVALYDTVESANNFYIVCEYCNEGDLSQLIKKKGKIPED